MSEIVPAARATELPVMLEVIGGRLVPTGGAR
jgi:hypothetical protein